MTKRLLIIPLILLGLTVGTTGILAQSAQGVIQVKPNALKPLFFPIFIGSSSIADANLQLGMKNANVKKVQEALKAIGYFSSGTDESFGPKTKEAIINFQKAQGLPTTGFFGPSTRAALKKGLLEKVGEVIIDNNVDITCMKIAIETRETTLLSAYDIFTSKLKTAGGETRKTDLLAAWSIQDAKERGMAIKVAWNKFRESVRTAGKEWKENEKIIWTKFTQNAKNCKASAVETQDLADVEVVE